MRLGDGLLLISRCSKSTESETLSLFGVGFEFWSARFSYELLLVSKTSLGGSIPSLGGPGNVNS